MKILYCSGNILVTTQMGGGASSQILGFVSALRKAGHQVDIELSGDAKIYPHIRTTKWLNWVRYKMPLSWLAYEALQILNNRKIRKRLKKINLADYDLLWQRYELFTTAYAEAAHAAGIPNVFFIDAPLIMEREMYARLWLKKAALQALKRNACLADRVIAISDATAEYVVEKVGNPSLQVHILPNGFSNHIIDANPETVQQVKQLYFGDFVGKVIGFIGSPMVWHHLDYLIKAAHRLNQVRHDFRVLIIGEGPDSANQKKLVADLGLPEIVKFSGTVPFAEIAAHLHALDIGVIPDSNSYFSPMKITEYMACGLAVVAPDLPSITRFCTNEEDALLFPKGDTELFYQCLLRLLDSPALVDSLGEKARTRALSSYSWSVRIQQLEAILKG
jgi:glycosyltransferase involved in cell wall biosynthesis